MIWDTFRMELPNKNLDFKMLGASNADPYVIKQIDGLGPPEVTNLFSKGANQRTSYQGGSAMDIQLIVKLGLNPNYGSNISVSDLRNAIYAYLTPGLGINATFDLMYQGTRIMNIPGFVSKIEINPFSKTPEVLITIDCMSSFWQRLVTTNVSTSGLGKAAPNIPYLGTAPSGFFLSMQFTAGMSSWAFRRQDNDLLFRIATDIQSGDILSWNTMPGSRSIVLTRGGVDTNVIDKVTTMNWLQLFPGDNLFATSSTNFNWLSFWYVQKEWGV